MSNSNTKTATAANVEAVVAEVVVAEIAEVIEAEVAEVAEVVEAVDPQPYTRMITITPEMSTQDICNVVGAEYVSLEDFKTQKRISLFADHHVTETTRIVFTGNSYDEAVINTYDEDVNSGHLTIDHHREVIIQ